MSDLASGHASRLRFDGAVALVTGGGTGIGAAAARRLAREGARVVLLGPDTEPLMAVAEDIEAIAVPGDAADPVDAERAVDAASRGLGGLDIVVTCAGGGEMGALADTDELSWDGTVRTNLQTCAVTCRAALPALISGGGGAIVVVSSVAALAAGPGIAGYATAKAALLGLVRSVAVDYGPQAVRANALCPGWVDTRMTETSRAAFAEANGISREEADRLANLMVPLRRSASPEEIAAIIAFLASNEAAFISGSTIVADGGQSAVDAGLAAFMLNATADVG